MFPSVLSLLIILLGSLASFLYILRRPNHRKNVPPGPPPPPIIGSLHKLGKLPHRTLHQLAKQYGPIMSVKLGSIPTIVISSPQAAELILKTHDAVLANRPKLQVSHYLSYGTKGLAFTEYGPCWRSVRKICTLELLSASKIEAFEPVRREELRLMVDKLKSAGGKGEVVNFTVAVGDLIQNITCRMIFGVANNNDQFIGLKSAIEEAMSLAGTFNIGDFVPFLASFDLQGLKKRFKNCSKTLDKVLEKIIEKHEEEADWEKKDQRDFTDVLLSIMNNKSTTSSYSEEQQQWKFDKTNIKAILIDMIVGAFDTSSVVILWALVELIKNPQVMKNLQNELQNIVGLDKMVEEKDLSKLTYLQIVVKESLRLHPAGPLLIPHEAMEDISVDGYYIPKKSRIIVNAWAIGRDSNVWSDNVDEFLPERFIGENIEFRGHSFQLIPFGSGRRGCPGMQLGLTFIQIVIAQLVHCFNLELPPGVLSSELDMSEKFGLSLPRASHLLLVPKYRLLV